MTVKVLNSYDCYTCGAHSGIFLLIYLPLEPWKLGEGGDHMDQYIFADNLCRLCRKKHISVEQLAEAIGKSPRQINRYRNGQCRNISLVTLNLIAEALDEAKQKTIRP